MPLIADDSVGAPVAAGEVAGGHAEDAAEGARELEGIGEADLGGDILHESSGGLEAFEGGAHFEAQGVLPGALVVVAGEEAADVGGVEGAAGGDFVQTTEAAVVGVDVMAAALVGAEGFGADGSQGEGGFRDAQEEVLGESGAASLAEGGFPQASGDQIFPEMEEVVGCGSLDDLAGLWRGGAEECAGLGTFESEEVFDERSIGGAGVDFMRDAGAIGEDSAGHDAMVAALGLEGSLSAGDEFDGELGQFPAHDAVIGRAVFAAAADDGEAGQGGFLRGGQIEAAGFGDLQGEVFGLLAGGGRGGGCAGPKRRGAGAGTWAARRGTLGCAGRCLHLPPKQGVKN